MNLPYDPEIARTINPQHADALLEEFHKKLRHIGKTTKLLDYGYITLLDFMGSDQTIAEAAWVSTEGAVTNKSPVPNFIDYLMRARHTGPFEQCSVRVRIKCPMFIGEQWLRHRTGKPNKQSGRYVQLDKEIYTPATWRRGSTGHNKQGSGEPFGEVENVELHFTKDESDHVAYETYQSLLEQGVAPELARTVLPASIYTSFVWKIDLHNLLHFLHLRMDSHAQQEMQLYARALHDLVRPLYPYTFNAWEDHVYNAVTISQTEQQIISVLLRRGLCVMGKERGEFQSTFRELAQLIVKELSHERPSKQDELVDKIDKIIHYYNAPISEDAV